MQITADTHTPTGVTGKDCSANPAPFPQSTPVAMAYIPFQQFSELYSPEQAYKRGTAFPDLDKPFLGGGVMK